MNKKRILFIGEASYLATGFSTYWNEVIKRIHETGKFEIAELGSYADPDDPRCRQVPWKFYPVQPSRRNREAISIYESSVTNQFGEWIFNDVCLDFKPDIVCLIRDEWMDEFVLRSPYRKFFKILWMPTIDGIPQKEKWLDEYSRCDGILTYSKWGMNILKKDGRKNTNLITVASPGADLEVFKPVPDKSQHKQKMGIDPNTIIIGTTMRNQKRKLFYDLIEAFAGWVNKNKTKGHMDRVRKTYLYLHTSYPDVGYDIGKAIREFNIGNKILMTYICANCKITHISFFNGEVCVCRKCGYKQAHPPNANSFCTRETLSAIYNLFDLYVQYSVCEGWGMPVTEAMCCGVPSMAVRYSAMEDHLLCPTSIPIEVGRYFYEAIIETEQKRALPNNQDFISKLDNFTKLSKFEKEELRTKTRKYAEELCDVYGQENKLPRMGWERTSKIWENVIDSINVEDNIKWEDPNPKFIYPNLKKPSQSMNNTEFMRWIILNIMCKPELINTTFMYDWVRHLNSGYIPEGRNKISINQEKALEKFLSIVNNYNASERKRIDYFNKSEKLEYSVI